MEQATHTILTASTTDTGNMAVHIAIGLSTIPTPPTPPKLYDHDGNYRGRLSSNPYDPDSVSNPYGRYGNRFSPDSINNHFGAGNPYSPNSPTNPYGHGLQIQGDDDD